MLATIIVISIISLISTPVVVNVIDNSRKEAFKNSAYNMIKSAQLNFAEDQVKGKTKDIIFTYNNGIETSNIEGKSLNYQGQKPKDGSLIIDRYGRISIAIHNGKYCAYKDFEDGLVFIEMISKVECEEKKGILYTDEDCFTFDENTKTITDYNKKKCPKEVVIPEEIRGIPVIHIGEDAFQGKGLKKVIIPDSVITIGKYAFYWNEITSVKLSNNLKIIEEGTFYFNQITTLIIPNSVTTIGDDAFYFNQIKDLTIPEGVTTIGDSAFSFNEIENLVIPNSVTTIGGWAFADNQLTNITLSNSITTIEPYTFYSNELTSVLIPNNVTRIKDYAFGYNNITQGNAKIDNKSYLVTLGTGVFSNNGSDKKTTITPTFLR